MNTLPWDTPNSMHIFNRTYVFKSNEQTNVKTDSYSRCKKTHTKKNPMKRAKQLLMRSVGLMKITNECDTLKSVHA